MMMSRQWFTLGVAVAASALIGLAPTKALAAEGIDCPYGAVSTEVQQHIFNLYRTRSEIDPDSRAALQNAVRGCALNRGWSTEAVQDAGLYTYGRILMAGLLASSPFAAEDLERLGLAFDRLDRETAERWMANGIGDADLPQMEALIAGSGVAVSEEQGQYVGEYFAARYIISSRAAAFAAR